MSLYQIGRICMKLAGRDAGKKGVIIEIIDNQFVILDGATRRKKVNVKHLEPMEQIVKIKDKASHQEVKSVLEKVGIIVTDKKSKKPAQRQFPVRKSKKTVMVKEGKTKKPVVKKATVKKAEAKETSLEQNLDSKAEKIE
ncbi:50S ribosomal protein L14e [Candidatus Woesearchaeota archaeon CG_4_10_14_0_2_um_filter_33_13]|nr:MAG: 50S ribosomal protein L14e [Candidatus Woesearchaeota archaeon CG_4_10_14_0_2_um_filter_33_13]